MKKEKYLAQVAHQEKSAENIYSMWLQFSEEAAVQAVQTARPGQFLSLYCQEGSRLLPRPISICEIDRAEGRLRVVYRVVGKGTAEFSGYVAGDRIAVMGPLGNGFRQTEGRALLMGGGIGIPPMLQLAKELSGKGTPVTTVLGYRDADLFLKEEFQAWSDVLVSTEDGSAGTKGNVIDAVRAYDVGADMIYACGPLPMLRGVKAYAEEISVPAQISMEERMACGIGACLGCVCQSAQTDPHSHVRNKRVCKDGPVFDAQEIVL